MLDSFKIRVLSNGNQWLYQMYVCLFVCDEKRSFSIFRIIAQMGPEDSWVAKWQRIGNILLYNMGKLMKFGTCYHQWI